MISFIKGILEEKREDSLVVENQGIGYEILVPATVLDEMPSTGNDVKIYTYMHVREDDLKLFGFLSKEDLTMFKMLIKVNGIGPKGALGILSVMTSDEYVLLFWQTMLRLLPKRRGLELKQPVN
ncbi:MAG: Holliday junction branch migration protein RuvA [Eubacterium sp.]